MKELMNFYFANTVKRKQAIDWGEIFAKDTSDKGLLPKMYKELLKLNNNKTKVIFKWIKKERNVLKQPKSKALAKPNDKEDVE